MNRSLVRVRIAVGIVLLAVLCWVVSPRRVVDTFASAEWEWLCGAALLVPLFVLLRMGKWLLLLRQSRKDIAYSAFVRAYLVGMAVGLVTPGRAGEVVRVWATHDTSAGQRVTQVGYFVAEKLVEVVCLVALAVVGVSYSGVATGTGVLLLCSALLALIVAHQTRARWSRVIHHLPVVRKWPDAERQAIVQAVAHLRLTGCALLSLACFVVYLLQVCLVMQAMGHNVSLGVVPLLPVVMVANLVPVTPGGFGMREGFAVVLLGPGGVPEAVALGSFFLTTVLDLVLPALVGSLLLSLGRRSGSTRQPVG